MKKFLTFICLIAIFQTAYAERRIAKFLDNTRQTHTVDLDCADYSIPRAYECKKMEVQFSDGTRYSPNNIPKESAGTFKYWISTLGYLAVGIDIYYVIGYLDTSGSSSSAEEKFDILEFGKGGKIKSKFGLLSYNQYQQKTKLLKPSMNITFTGGL